MPDFGVLNAPPLVKQVDEMSCWAAAMEAWLAVASGRKPRSQHELIGVMQQKGALNDDGYLIIKKGIPILAQMAGMSIQVFPKHKKSKLTTSLLLKKLVKGHVYMAYNVFGIGHAVVVYGVVDDPSNERMFAMDPWMGRGYTSDTLSDYKRDSDEFFIGWPAY